MHHRNKQRSVRFFDKECVMAKSIKLLCCAIRIVCLSSMLTLVGCHKTQPIEIITSQQIKTLSEQDIIAMSVQACREMDKQAVIISNNHRLSRRLSMLTQQLPHTVNGISINYKIYLNTALNAWSTANGCVRMNSHLIKSLNDNELLAVIAHELGHIALKHGIVSFRLAPYIEVNRRASDMVLIVKEDLAQQFELDADNYAYTLLEENGIDTQGLVSMLVKLPLHSFSSPSSHPSNRQRIDNIMQKLNRE